MRNPTPTLALALVGLLAGSAAFAQAPPPPAPGAAPAAAAPPPPPGAAPETAALPPPPPGGPGALPAAPPPPPPGAHVVIDRGANGFVHVDVKCLERDSTQDCAGLAERMLDKLAGR